MQYDEPEAAKRMRAPIDKKRERGALVGILISVDAMAFIFLSVVGQTGALSVVG